MNAPTTAASVLSFLLVTAAATATEKQRPAPSAPREFVIGRHTYFDFGPPSDFYEILLVRPTDGGSSIQRLTLTPPGLACLQPGTVEFVTASIADDVSTLLGNKNPCSIPEKALRREQERCKHCVTFSGANVVMQVQCGKQVRRIRMDILDRDLFDAAPRTPEHTSWTMDVLSRLDQAIGPGVKDRPAFSLPNAAAFPAPVPPTIVDALNRGVFDGLLGTTAGELSALFAESQKVVPPPTVELVTSSPFRPTSQPAFRYPDIARMARVEGDVSFTLTVTTDGGASDLEVLAGPPLLTDEVAGSVSQWKFPLEVAGRVFDGVITFRTNCPAIGAPKGEEGSRRR